MGTRMCPAFSFEHTHMHCQLGFSLHAYSLRHHWPVFHTILCSHGYWHFSSAFRHKTLSTQLQSCNYVSNKYSRYILTLTLSTNRRLWMLGIGFGGKSGLAHVAMSEFYNTCPRSGIPSSFRFWLHRFHISCSYKCKIGLFSSFCMISSSFPCSLFLKEF